MQFAALQATKGTSLPTRAGRLLTKGTHVFYFLTKFGKPRLLRPSAVAKAPPVAAQQLVRRVFVEMTASPDLESKQLCKNAIHANFEPIGVVDQGIEALIEPLPEDDRWSGPVESHHAAGNNHVERNLWKSRKKQNSISD